MTMLLSTWTVIMTSAGVLMFVTGTIGLLRFPDMLSRLHALTKVDNAALGLIVIGLLPYADGLAGAGKLILIWVLMQITGGTVSQMVAQRLRQGA